MNSNDFTLKVEVSGNLSEKPETKFRICTFLFFKDVPYPMNFIGGSPEVISKKLNLTLNEARELLITKLREALVTVEEGRVKGRLLDKIGKYQRAIQWENVFHICVVCGRKFHPKTKRQAYCTPCRRSLNEGKNDGSN